MSHVYQGVVNLGHYWVTGYYYTVGHDWHYCSLSEVHVEAV